MSLIESTTDPRLALVPRPENERLILSLVREHRGMSKAEIARATGLSAQSATNIVNRLEAEGLLRAGKSVRGKVGQPSKPYLINAEGALTIGVKVGRQSVEIATMGFDYEIIEHRQFRYEYPVYEAVRDHIFAAMQALIDDLGPARARRILGVGLALPEGLSSWESAIGAPRGLMAPWDEADLRAEIEAAFGLAVSKMNDASAACLAALKVGKTTEALYEGMSGNASAIGSLPMKVVASGPGDQLIGSASLQVLEEKAAQAGIDPQVFYQDAPLSAAAEDVLTAWEAVAAPALAFSFVAGQAILDVEVMVLDASLAHALRARLVDATIAALVHYDTRGLRPFRIIAGDGGVRARSIGSALLPFQAVTEYDLM